MTIILNILSFLGLSIAAAALIVLYSYLGKRK